MNIEKEREAFIEHFKSTDCYKELVEYCLGLEDDEHAIFELNALGKFKFGGDGFGVVQVAFDAWQASTLRAAEKLEGCVVVPESEYNQMAQFKDLYKRAIVNAKKRKDQLNWAHVAGLGVGSTKAMELLKELGIDPSATSMHAAVEAARGGNE